MERIPYYQLEGLEQVYLEDSYVLDLRTEPTSVEFLLRAVLTEEHPLYMSPLPGEQYCYRSALLRFSDVERVEWMEKSIVPSTDATGAVDYGNIDEFYFAGGHYYLSGDWGRLEIKSSPPSLKFQTLLP
ncbi:MAG TPA: hypothetical protein VHH35_04145 [Pyrinomonadaceae bacterium]|nr:hypothetical protein [Pyrinomonadaceae bacterium]